MKTVTHITMFLFGTLLIHFTGLAQQTKDHPITKQKNTTMANNNEKETKEYILLVYFPLGYGTDQAKEVRDEWNTLLDKWKADNTFVISFVFPAKGHLISGADKTVKEGSLTTDGLRLTSSLIIRAVDIDEALALAKTCPVFKQGATIEVRETLPRPVQVKQ